MTKEPLAERNLSISRLFTGTKRPVAVAVSQLAPHVRRIRSRWLESLKERFTMDRATLRALANLRMETQHENLTRGDFNAYASAIEGQGRLFQKSGVPIEMGVAAMICYFEACEPYLELDGPNPPAAALARFTWVSQLFLIQGFTMEYQQLRQELEQRRREAEQHSGPLSAPADPQEQTGRQIARDLHGEIGNNLLGAKRYLEAMSTDLNDRDFQQVRQKIQDAGTLIVQAIDDVRRLAFNLGLHPILEQADLVSTLHRYASQFTERTGIKVQFQIDVPEKLPSIYETTLYRVLQGTLSNVAAESNKAGNVEVHVGVENGELWMSVEDNGSGFDIEKTLNDPSQAFGLIRQRVELLGGSLRMEPRLKRVGKGTSGTMIELHIPLHGTEAA